MADELKSCPFCGSAAMALKDWQGFWAVRCNNDGTLGKEVVPCNAAGPERPTEAEAIAAWNRREIRAIIRAALKASTGEE